MKKFLAIFLSLLFSLSLIGFGVLFVVEQASFDIGYHHELIDKYTQTQKMDKEQIYLVSDHVVKYLKGDVTSIQYQTPNGYDVFNDREVIHMEDVKKLFDMLSIIKLSLLGVSLVTFVALVFMEGRQALRRVSISNFIALLIYGVAIGGLALYYYVDFSSFWTFFHQMLFTNDLWLMLPTDLLIIMYTAEFFVAIISHIITLMLVFVGVVVLASVLILVFIPSVKGRKFEKRNNFRNRK